MDTEQLKQFMSIVNEGSMTAASEKLFVSQPTLSKQLKKLETELGSSLFSRENASLKLTNCGHIAYTYASLISDQLDGMYESMINSKAYKKYTVCSASFSILDHVLPILSAENKGVLISSVFDSYNAKKLLLDGTYDLFISPNKADDPEICVLPLFKDRIYISVPVDDPLSKHTELNDDDLQGQTIVRTQIGNAIVRVRTPYKNVTDVRYVEQPTLNSVRTYALNNGYLYFADRVTMKYDTNDSRTYIPMEGRNYQYNYNLMYLKRREKEISFISRWLKNFFSELFADDDQLK